MYAKIIEAVQTKEAELNWGKFMVMRPSAEEWSRKSEVDKMSTRPLLSLIGWPAKHIWVHDYQTGEAACFVPGGVATCDLKKHQIWVCPLFEPFLKWLYLQDLTDLSKLPDLVELPDAEFQLYGYRREGS